MRPFATLLAALALAAPAVTAQINVNPNTPGALNTAVNNNTTAGQVFVLQPGATYRLTDRMEPTVSFTVRSSGGDCPVVESDCPLIQPLTQSNSTERILAIRTANVSATFEGVAITNTSSAGGSDTRTFRIQAPGATFTLRRTLVFNEPTQVIRVDSEVGNDGPDIYVYDSVFRNIGSTASATREEGRVVDDRGEKIGELVMTGNTFSSVSNRIVRDDGEDVGSFRFENNTVHLVGSRVLETGDVLGDVIIRNNLIVDTGLEGGEDDGDPATEDGSAQVRLGGGDNDVIGGDVTIENNSFVFDTALLEDPQNSPVPPRLYNGDAEDAAEGRAAFAFRPAFDDPQPGFFSNASDPVDYGYPTSSPAFTAATDGGPLGARIWFDGLSVTDPRDVSVSTFAELQQAVASAEPGDVITVTGDLTATATLVPEVAVTVRGADADARVRITAGAGFTDRFFEPRGDLTLENLVLDGQGRTEEFVRITSDNLADETEDDGDDDLTVRNSVFVDNVAGEDGIRVDDDAGDIRIIDSAIAGVGRRPIGLRSDGELDVLDVRRTTIANSADRIRLEGEIDEVVFDRVTVSGLPGDAIDFDSNDFGSVTITNSILIPNEGDGDRAIDHGDAPPTFVINHTNVFPLEDADGEDNLDDAAEAAFNAGTGNVSVDPQFADAGSGDFSLPSGSPLLTAADDGGAVGAPSRRILFGVDAADGPEAAALALAAFPNPAAGQLALTFTLSEPADVRVAAYDVLGREVARLGGRTMAVGPQRLDVSVGSLASGVYVVRLEAGEASSSVRLTVVR